MKASFTFEEGLHLYGQLGRAYGLVRRWEESREAYETLLATAREAGDREAEWEALQHLAMLGTDYTLDPEADDETFRGVKERAEREAEEEGGEGRRKAGAEAEASEVFVWSPEYALGRVEEALSLARELGRDDLISMSLLLSALAAAWGGRWGHPKDAADKLAKARRLYALSSDRVMEGEFLTLYAWAEVMDGRPEEALRLGRERLAIAHELGGRDIYLADSHGLVLALLEVGDYEEALSVACMGARRGPLAGSSRAVAGGPGNPGRRADGPLPARRGPRHLRRGVGLDQHRAVPGANPLQAVRPGRPGKATGRRPTSEPSRPQGSGARWHCSSPHLSTSTTRSRRCCAATTKSWPARSCGASGRPSEKTGACASPT